MLQFALRCYYSAEKFAYVLGKRTAPLYSEHGQPVNRHDKEQKLYEQGASKLYQIMLK